MQGQFIVPDGDVSTSWTTFGSGTAHWDRLNSGILSGTPDDTNGIQGQSPSADRFTFTNPSFQGTCLEIKVHFRARNTIFSQGVQVELFSDGSTSDGQSANQLLPASFTDFTATFAVQKTAAQLANLEVEIITNSTLFDDQVSEIEVEIVLTSSSSSSESLSSSCSSSSSCDSAFSSSSSSSFSSSSSSSSCVAAWVQHYKNDSTGWSCSVNCSSSPPWTVAGPGMKIGEQGTWVVGYRPIKIRITATHNLGTTWDLTLNDGTNLLATCSVPIGGGTSPEVDIDWSNNIDMDEIVDSQAPVGRITNIEFLECGGSASSSSSSSCNSAFSSSSSSSCSSSSSYSSSCSSYSSPSSSSSSSST